MQSLKAETQASMRRDQKERMRQGLEEPHPEHEAEVYRKRMARGVPLCICHGPILRQHSLAS